jgi:5-methylthioribose kinase
MNDDPLTVDTVAGYLVGRGVVDGPASSVEAESLGGGVSNVVLRVTADGDCLVVKQPLPNLAVDDDWPADVERVHNEAAAARAYEDIIRTTGLSDVRVPRVVFDDTDAHVIGIGCAPSGATMWKRDLLDGRVDPTVAERLGRFLGTSHAAAAGDESLRTEFAHEGPFEQLRLDPYHRAVADRHPDLAPAIEAELDRIEGVSRTLVHGDFSPKNVLVDRRNGEPTLWLLDFEVAHWGDPAFDTAFMLNHLFIKSIYHAADGDEYVGAARRFWDAYVARVDWEVEPETVRELAILMLARVDGKSPVEYVTAAETKRRLRTTARRALVEGVETVDGFVGLVEEAVEEAET